MKVSYYGKVYDLLPERRDVAWPDFFTRWYEADSDADKEQIPLFSCDLFKDGRGREKGRTRDNVEMVSGLLLDYDDDHGVAIEQAESCWADYEYFLHTTYSHQVPGVWQDAFRMVLPFPEPVTVAEYEAFLKGWALPFAAGRNAKFKPLPVGHAGYFLPTRRPSMASEYHRHNSGPMLDPRVLAPTSTSASPTPTGTLLHMVRPPPPIILPSESAPVPVDLFRGMETAHEVADLTTLETHCSFMRYGRESAAALSEPEWRSWLSVVIRCRGGSTLAHEISSVYPKYNREQTQQKIDRLMSEAGPHSCEHIASTTDRGGCSTCPLKGKIKGPLLIQAVVEKSGSSDTQEVVVAAESHQRKLELDAEVREAEGAVDRARRRLAELKVAESARKRLAKAAASLDQLGGVDSDATAAAVAIDQAKRLVTQAERELATVQKRSRNRSSLDGPDPDVLDSLSSEMGVPHSSRLNIERILANDPLYRNSFTFNAFSQQILYEGQPAEDHKDTRLTVDLERRYGIRADTKIVREICCMLAKSHTFHPVKDLLRSLTWDGTERLNLLMRRGFGAPITPMQTEEYISDVGRKLCISAVARIMDPQAKNEMIVVATGDQGQYKSTAFGALAWKPEWFGDSHLPIGNKDSYMSIQGKWFYEIAEMDSFKKAESTAIKSFLSSRSDTYRKPFGAHVVTEHRNTVFVGTTNEDHFLDDPTGSRRYAPVRTGRCDVEWITSNIAQIWAEAVVRYDLGERWWYMGEEAVRLKQASVDFQVTDGWSVLVLDAIFHPTSPATGFYTNERILIEWVNVPKERITKREKNRIAAVMKQLGIKQIRLQQMREALRLGYTHAPLGYQIDDKVRASLMDPDNVIPFKANEDV
jgi:predicted P-loop ATPase